MRTGSQDGELPTPHEVAGALAVLAAMDDPSHLRAVMGLLPVAALFFAGRDPSTAEPRECNAAAREILSGEGKTGASYQLYAPDRGEPLPPARYPWVRALAAAEQVYDEEIHILRPDGSWRVALSGAVPVTRDGRTIGALWVLRESGSSLQAAPDRDLLSTATSAGHVAADLRRAHDRLQTVLAMLPAGVCILEADGRIATMNPVFESIWAGNAPEPPPRVGSIEETGVYRGWRTDTGEPIRPEEWASSRALADGETVIGEVIDIERFDGTRATILNNAAPLRADDGRVIGAVVAIQDITRLRRDEEALADAHERLQAQAEELRAANEELEVQAEELQSQAEELQAQAAELRASEETLRASEARYRSLFNGMTEGFALHEIVLDEAGTPCDYRFLDINPAFESLTGLKRDAVVGRRVREVLPDIESFWIETYGHVALTGEPAHFENFFPPLGRHYKVFAYRPAPLQFAVVFMDITERKRMEKALARNERLLDAILENIVAQVAYLDRDMNFVRVNAAYAEGSGYAAAELIGRNHFDLFPDEENEALFARVRDTGEPHIARAKPFVYQNQPERGVTYWDWWLRPIHGDSGETEGVVLSLVDVTTVERARREAERLNKALSDADRQKDEFLAMLAHELRNPLAAVIAALQLLRTPNISESSARRARDAAARQASHMARLLDDLLDVSRITRGKITLRQEDVAVASFIESGVEAAAPLIEAQGHRLLVSLPHEPLHVHGDPVRLAQVVANLLGNAARYTPNGGEIRLAADHQDGEIVIHVSDNGIGIPAEILPHIFDLFVQGDRSPDQQQGGLGIGLTMVRALAEMHGGRVAAHSDGPGRGSEFVVTLPLAAERPRSGPEGAGSIPVTPRRILVVDDHADAAELLALILEGEGHQVRAVHSGRAALDALSETTPDVVLLDIGMPGMDGYEVARRLRSDPRLEGVILVALTGYGQEEDRERTREAGFDFHLVKPVEPEDLLRALASLP